VKLSRAGEWEALSGVCKPRYVVGRSRRKEAGVDGGGGRQAAQCVVPNLE
jgi:hypothetical protein